jgi:hypothetical protein
MPLSCMNRGLSRMSARPAGMSLACLRPAIVPKLRNDFAYRIDQRGGGHKETSRIDLLSQSVRPVFVVRAVELAGNQPAPHSLLLETERPMKAKTVRDHEGKKRPADTARAGGAAYAPHDEGAEKLAQRARDNRTPDKMMGKIKHAKKSEKK